MKRVLNTYLFAAKNAIFVIDPIQIMTQHDATISHKRNCFLTKNSGPKKTPTYKVEIISKLFSRI